MNIRDAKQEIIHTILAYTAKNSWGGYAIPALRQRPILLIGPPGIGKTAIMEQAANACGIGFASYTMTHHTRQSAIGLPFIERRTFGEKEYPVTEYTMSEIISSVFRCIEESGCREGLLFLDEINCVSETLAPAMLQFLQNKIFGSHRLPEGWILAAAGNPPEYNKSVREFDIATLDRLKYIQVEATYDAWRPYALEMNIHGAILSYLDSHHDHFYVLKQSYSSRSFVTARGWEDLSCLLLQYETLGLPVTAELIGQYLHEEELARDFSGYYHLYESRKQMLPVLEMLEGTGDAGDRCLAFLQTSSFDEKLHLVHLMLSCMGQALQSWKSSAEQCTQLEGLLDRLQRYQKLQKLNSPLKAVPGFLKKEQEVLAVRRTHGLSSERELQDIQQSLYTLRQLSYEHQANSSSGDFFAQKLQLQKDALHQQAASVLQMLENGIILLSRSNGPEFSLFLSSLYANPLTAAFLKKHPSSLCEEHHRRLDFRSREETLRQKLQSSLAEQ